MNIRKQYKQAYAQAKVFEWYKSNFGLNHAWNNYMNQDRPFSIDVFNNARASLLESRVQWAPSSMFYKDKFNRHERSA